MSGLDIASFVIDCVGLVLAIIALVVAYAAWSAEFKNRRWHQAHERLLKWNEEVLATTEKALAHPGALNEARSRLVFDARLRIYARQQSTLDIETVFLDPVFKARDAEIYESGVFDRILWRMSVVTMQFPYANEYVLPHNSIPPAVLTSDNEVKQELVHLRERCGVFDRFTRQRPEPKRLRIAWKTLTSWRKIRKYRNREGVYSYNDYGTSHELWLG